MKLLQKLWTETDGFVISSELMLVQSIILAGVLAGATVARDSVVREFTDIGRTLRSMNQSFSITGIQGHTSQSAPSQFVDPSFQSTGVTQTQFTGGPQFTGVPSQFARVEVPQAPIQNDLAQLPRAAVPVRASYLELTNRAP
jgi:hypothetical protein